MFTLNCKGKLIVADQALVMGIINATPDSFYKGNMYEGMDGIIALVEKMIGDGADIIDVGAESSRPGSKPVSADEEFKRLIPVIEMISGNFPGMIISVDTYRSMIATAAVEAGATMINDISGGDADPAMIETVAGLGVPYICMHMKGTPESMDRRAFYENVTDEVLKYFIVKMEACKKAGINDLILDPGFGFAKTAAHNFTLLRDLSVFSMTGCPVLVGLSRKSTICKTIGVVPEDALNGTTVLNTLALNNGAGILRVHDVKEAREAVLLHTAYKTAALL